MAVPKGKLAPTVVLDVAPNVKELVVLGVPKPENKDADVIGVENKLGVAIVLAVLDPRSELLCVCVAEVGVLPNPKLSPIVVAGEDNVLNVIVPDVVVATPKAVLLVKPVVTGLETKIGVDNILDFYIVEYNVYTCKFYYTSLLQCLVLMFFFKSSDI